MNGIRAIAAAIIFAGGTILISPSPAHSTYQDPDLLPKHCCIGDVNGDGTPDFECCTRNPAGCTASPKGCTINQN